MTYIVVTDKLIENLDNLEISDVIDVPDGKLIIMMKDKRKLKVKVSFDEEFKKALMMERNKQLNRFSNIYFKKVELNTVIDEKQTNSFNSW